MFPSALARSRYEDDLEMGVDAKLGAVEGMDNIGRSEMMMVIGRIGRLHLDPHAVLHCVYIVIVANSMRRSRKS
jgi:hypothetical protein